MSTLPSSSVTDGFPTLSLGTLSRRASLARHVKQRISSGLSYALADQVIYSFGNMVVAAILSRHCAQRQFGIYILTQRVMDVLIQVSNVFLWAPFTFNLPETSAERRAVYQGSILTLQTAFCIVFTIGLWLTTQWTHSPSRAVYDATFAPLIYTAAGILFREFTRRMYFSHMRMQEAFWTDFGTVLLQIVGVVWLYRVHALSVPNTLAVLCAGAVIVSLWWLAREWSRFRLRPSDTFHDLRLNLRLGRWFLGSNMVSLASMQCNPWVLSGLLGGASVGAYAVCESVVNIPRVALTSMQNVMGPMMARAHAENGATALRVVERRADRTLLLGSAGFAAVIAMLGPTVARVIFRTAPPNARVLLIFLAINLVAYAATLAPSYGLTALRRANMTFYANGIGVLVQAAACVLLVRRFQVPGAAAALLIGNSIILLVLRAGFRAAETAST